MSWKRPSYAPSIPRTRPNGGHAASGYLPAVTSSPCQTTWRMVENLRCLYLIEVVRLGVYWTERFRHASNLRNGDDPPSPDRHGCRLAAAAPATGHHVSPRGKPHPQSPTRRSPAAPDRHRPPPPRGTRLPARPHTSARGRRD